MCRRHSTWILVFVACLSLVQADASHYRAAILELVQFTDLSNTATKIVEENFKIYEIAASEAGLDGVDIIVFPECGLFPPMKLNQSSLLEIAEDVPNPKLEFFNPCNQTKFENRPILSKLSCMAKQHAMFIVANIFDKKNCEFTQFCDAEDTVSCSPGNTECPENGHFFYNTNVVFNREGVLIARYYKNHLYFEPLLKTPDVPEHVYFETDFGNFTTVICFDLIFKDAVEDASKPEVDNLAYPTYWFNHLPFIFFAVPYQQAWAVSNRVNLLAANVHDPRTGTIGSGIYSADGGALIYTDNPDGKSKLLISNVPKIIGGDSNEFPANPKRFIIENGDVHEDEVEEHGPSKADCSTDVLGPPSSLLTDYRCSPPEADQYEYYKLNGKEGELEVCSNSFCCFLSYRALSMEEEYFLGITGNNLKIATYSYGSEICFLARCETIDGISCKNYKLISDTIFDQVELKGNFSTKYVYPFAVNSGVRMVDADKWQFDGNEIVYTNQNKNSSLIFLGLYGRIYDKDILDG